MAGAIPKGHTVNRAPTHGDHLKGDTPKGGTAVNRVEQPDGYLSSYSLGQIFAFMLKHSCSVIRSSWLNVADCGKEFSVVLVIMLQDVPIACVRQMSFVDAMQ